MLPKGVKGPHFFPMLKLAVKLAEKSKGKYKMGCVLTDKKGNILSTGINSYAKTHPIQQKYAEAAGQPARVFLHAEVAAICRLPYGAVPKRAYVARRTESGVGLAKPCPVCIQALSDMGITEIVYTM